jgi:2-succinyl-6-hydroxy-2,4-cyclohexadiene-1-carboxylate synthase
MELTPTLFLHGFTGSGAAWSHVTASLSDRLAASCPNLPGHAGAALPRRLGREGFDAAIESIAAQISSPAIVIGYSQGARLALALAVRHPEKVIRLVLESGTAGLVRHQDRALRQAEDEARARMIETEGVEPFIAQWEKLPLFAGIPPSTELDQRRRAHSPAGLAGALRCLGLGVQPSFWHLLPRLFIPTLLITGARDAKFTALARKMAGELPLGWHVTVPNAGHAVHLEAPREWAAEVRAFVSARFSHENHPEEIRT